MHWELLVAAAAVVVSTWGILVPIFIHLDNKTDKQIAAIYQTLKEMREENKDFIERWAKETSDFHGRLCKIEEHRNRILMGEK